MDMEVFLEGQSIGVVRNIPIGSTREDWIDKDGSGTLRDLDKYPGVLTFEIYEEKNNGT